MITFKTLKDFIEHKTKCSLCDSALSPRLVGRIISRRMPPEPEENYTINAPLTGDDFVFKLEYTSPYISINKKCKVNIISSELSSNDGDGLVKEVWTKYSPRIELTCKHKECKHNFYVLSSPMIFWSNDPNEYDPKMWGFCNVHTDVECFNLNKKLWVALDEFRSKTYVYKTDGNFLDPPFTMPLMSVVPENKEKVFNRIKTIINFS